MKTCVIFSAAVLLAFTVGCADSSPRTRAAATGAATGAALGGVIGHQSGETGEGAALGAAVGGVIGAATAPGARRDRDREIGRTGSYSSEDYMELMTPDEVAILQSRARASGRTNYELTDFLTAEEKENLRRRDQANAQIGR